MREDPWRHLYFEQSIRVTTEHGHGNIHQVDRSSPAYWYQVGRTEPLPGIGGYKDRIAYAWGGAKGPGRDRRGLPWHSAPAAPSSTSRIIRRSRGFGESGLPPGPRGGTIRR